MNFERSSAYQTQIIRNAENSAVEVFACVFYFTLLFLVLQTTRCEVNDRLCGLGCVTTALTGSDPHSTMEAQLGKLKDIYRETTA